jgi:hypothetical protein
MENRLEILLKQAGNMIKPNFKTQKGKGVTTPEKIPLNAVFLYRIYAKRTRQFILRAKLKLNSELFENQHALLSLNTLPDHALNDYTVVPMSYVRWSSC